MYEIYIERTKKQTMTFRTYCIFVVVGFGEGGSEHCVLIHNIDASLTEAVICCTCIDVDANDIHID